MLHREDLNNDQDEIISKELDLFWKRLQKVAFDGDEIHLEDEEKAQYMLGLRDEWMGRTNAWYDFLSLPIPMGVSRLKFYLAQETITVLPMLEELKLPKSIELWFCRLYKERPMFFRGGQFTLALVEGSLFWKLWETMDLLPKSNLANPYDPIIEFFDWGGWIYHEHGAITNFHPLSGSWSGSPRRAEFLIKSLDEEFSK
jgi:hypothetical protein